MNCTFAQNTGTIGAAIYCAQESALNRTIVAHNGPGEGIRCTGSISVDCCDVYGNAGGDWVGGLAGLEELNGNFSSDPLFCDAAHGDFRINEASECNQPPCGLVGACPVGCGPSHVAEAELGSGFRMVPNPTSGACRVVLPKAGSSPASVAILDVAGRVVRRLSPSGGAPAGATFTWDGRDGAGVPVPAGVYLARVSTSQSVRTGRLVVVR